MSKVNGIGTPAREVDRIIDKAIQLIGTGAHRYSCCALTPARDTGAGWKVRKVYTRTFGPATIYPDHFGYVFSSEVQKAAPFTTLEFRVTMLSLFRAAWRDLV